MTIQAVHLAAHSARLQSGSEELQLRTHMPKADMSSSIGSLFRVIWLSMQARGQDGVSMPGVHVCLHLCST